MSRPVLKKGDKGAYVEFLQIRLDEQGFHTNERSPAADDCVFGEGTLKAVKKFQGTHLGPDGKFLDVDGVVGPATWWALDTPVGENQRSYLPALVPGGLSEAREQFLEIPLHEHEIGVKEEPSGSNWSTSPEGGIAKYTSSTTPAAWCMRFAKWCYRQGVSKGWVIGDLVDSLGDSGSCSKTRKRAQEMNREGTVVWHDNDGKYVPRPGDMGIMDGHVVIVLRTGIKNGKVDSINTVEGNSGNRVKVGYRPSSVMLGYVNLFGDADTPVEFELGTVEAEKTGAYSTR